jgi:LPS export ABC transporter protein LptC
MTRGRGIGLSVAVALALTSCALDYGDGALTPADQVPQMVFTDLKQTGMKDAKPVYLVESASSEVFPSKKQLRLKNFRFQEFDADGKVASTGESDAAVLDTSTNDATLTGRLKVHSSDRGVGLEIHGGPTGALSWANDDRLLRTGVDAAVTMTKDDGSQVQARGLTLDLNSNTLELTDGVQGRWQP